MAPNKLNRFMFVRCDSWCIDIRDGGWNVFPVIRMCFLWLGCVSDKNKKPFLVLFNSFVCLLTLRNVVKWTDTH